MELGSGVKENSGLADWIGTTLKGSVLDHPPVTPIIAPRDLITLVNNTQVVIVSDRDGMARRKSQLAVAVETNM